MSDETIFDKIISGGMDADVVYEDDQVMAFRDINPQAPVHVLVIPKKQIETVNHIEETDEVMVGRLMRIASEVAKQEEISEDGYRLVVNCGDDAGQTVQHLHVHLIGGRKLGWPPG